MAGNIIKHYGTILKGIPLKSGTQQANTPKKQGTSPYPNGTPSKKQK